MNKETLAYLAGAMDADGFFSIRSHTIRGSTTYSEFIGLGQVSDVVPNMLRDTFGGTVRQRQRDPKWKPFFYWVASNRNAASASKTLLPHLRLKRRQAELICELRESKELPTAQRRAVRVGVRGTKTNPAVVAQRESIYAEVKALNRSGLA